MGGRGKGGPGGRGGGRFGGRGRGSLATGPSRGDANDYCQHFVDTGQRPQNFLRDSHLVSRPQRLGLKKSQQPTNRTHRLALRSKQMTYALFISYICIVSVTSIFNDTTIFGIIHDSTFESHPTCYWTHHSSGQDASLSK